MAFESSVRRPTSLALPRLQLPSSQDRIEAPQQRLLGIETQAPPPKVTATLPPELIYHIIELAAPPPRLRSFRDHYKTLHRFSLVDKEWRGIAQTVLFRYVHLRTTKPYEVLRDVLLAENRREIGAEERLGAVAEEIRLGEDEQWTIAQVKILLQFLPGVKRIWIASKPGFRGPSVWADSLSALPNLTHLHLDNSDLVPASAISLPLLSHLSFSDPTSVGSVLALLKTAQLPQLKSLSIILWTRFRDEEHLQPLQEALSSCAARLDEFLFKSSGALVPQDLHAVFSHFTNLRHLSLSIPDGLLPVLQALPCQLSTLRLVSDSPFASQIPGEALKALSVIEVVEEWPPCLAKLHRLFVTAALTQKSIEKVQRGSRCLVEFPAGYAKTWDEHCEHLLRW